METKVLQYVLLPLVLAVIIILEFLASRHARSTRPMKITCMRRANQLDLGYTARSHILFVLVQAVLR